MSDRMANHLCHAGGFGAAGTRLVNIVRRLAALLAAVGLLLAVVSVACAEQQRPNIVLIMVDDMGYSDMGCFGAVKIQTPRLDQLAAEGIRFTQFYNNAKCTETRESLMTGRWWRQVDRVRTMENQATMAELLREAGYATSMVGKWHLGDWNSAAATPVDRGFDRYFGFLGGTIDFFTAQRWQGEWTGETDMWLDNQPYEVPDDFYSTDAFTDYAKKFVDEAVRQREKPFFLYVAHNAPHFPLQAPPEEIEKYRGQFLMGWDKLREMRYQQMQEFGILDRSISELSPRDPIVEPWDSLSAEQQQEQDLLMATYAAMMDRLDQNVGRLLDHLEDRGVAENTIVLFFSDNGACPYDFNRTPDRDPGPAGTFRTYNSPWANVSNTPLRLYKQWAHEGGSATPMLVRWPSVIEPGGLTREAGHLVDLMPTLLEAAGVEYPQRFKGRELAELPGVSLMPLLRGEDFTPQRPIFWEYRGHHGVRYGGWKLVAERGRDWELYYIPEDRAEMHDLVDQQPQVVERLAGMYEQWAEQVGTQSHAWFRSRPQADQPR